MPWPTLAAARHVGVVPQQGVDALSAFKSVKRRMEKVAEVRGITIYDDFAHHPTAIATTLDGLRKKRRRCADHCHHRAAFQLHEARRPPRRLAGKRGPGRSGGLVRAGQSRLGSGGHRCASAPCRRWCAISLDGIIDLVKSQAQPGTHVVIMSNGGFGGLHGKLAEALQNNESNGPERITLAMTGASGAQYGLRLLDCLVREDREVHFLISKAAQLVMATETDVDLPPKPQTMQAFLTEYTGAAAGPDPGVRQGRLDVAGGVRFRFAERNGGGAVFDRHACRRSPRAPATT